MRKTVTPIAYDDQEDALDELIQSQMSQIEQKGNSDLRTGGYSDVDVQFEKKYSQKDQQ